MIKKCIICGKEFNALRSAITCSKECSEINTKKLMAKWWKEKRPVKFQICAYCGKEFKSRDKKKFCSKKCHSDAMRESSTGRKWTDEMKKAHSMIRKGKTWEEIFGKKKSIELKKIKSNLMKNQIPWNKDTKGLMVAWNKGIPWSEERKEHLRKAVKKAYESKELRDIHRQNTIRFLKNGGMKNKDTKIELIFEDTLKRMNIRFEKQKQFKLGIADFYLPEYDAFIFCDGDYWHNYPNGKPRDSKQVEYLKENGFNVFRFWEHDILKDCKSLINEIIQGGKYGKTNKIKY